MEKRLNVEKASQAMEASGLTQTALAKQLDVSKEAVSQWLKQKSFPRPNKLLKLAKLLNLTFNELVIREEVHAPVIAFRKMKGTKTNDHHVEKAQETGRFLRNLVPYLPFDTLAVPPTLKDPGCNYHYLQQVASKVRHEIGISEKGIVDFHLIRKFAELQAVIVPVLWGNKQTHENAIHIYLPDSQSTWVYLNLDVNIHDFKFWMAHELGHCLSPSLRGEEAEDFADAFAGALLFSSVKAKNVYERLFKQRSKKARLETVIEIAEKEVISPYTIYREINNLAANSNMPEFDLEPEIFKWTTIFNKKYKNLSEGIFKGKDKIDSKDYIEKCTKEFQTPFFSILSQYLKESQKGTGFVQAVTDLPLLDARGIYEELT